MATTVTTTKNASNSQLATTVPPNQSLYIQNLPEKLQKDDLRRELYILFSTYGPVFDVVALKTKSMRGQAHVLFRDVQSATQAMRACQGFEFSGREMRISYSKNRSHTLAKMTGTFNQPTAAAEKPNAASAAPGAPTTFAAIPGAAPAQATSGAPAAQIPNGDGAPPQGTKRPRDEDEDEVEEAEMEVDDDDEMEMSDDD
ncbi:hypothetical protein LTR86_004901 [Recurvomyces mirabilis]|nr:hypothetical protein LTR86_004901 [Recurvomyces mirabilis]